jgi:hypothetical protein
MMDKYQKAVNSAKKHIETARKIMRGQLCKCGQPAVDRWRKKYVCYNCLNGQGELPKLEDFTGFRMSSVARCQDFNEGSEELAMKKKRRREKKWWRQNKGKVDATNT